jgi:hypothetical protein
MFPLTEDSVFGLLCLGVSRVPRYNKRTYEVIKILYFCIKDNVMQSQKLNALQLELLNLYSFEPKEEDLLAIKNLLAQYFSKKLQKNIQKAVEEKNITQADLDNWINE